MMRPLDWLNESEFLIEGIRFVCLQGDYSQESTPEKFVLLKDADILRQYSEEFSGIEIKRVFEFGMRGPRHLQ